MKITVYKGFDHSFLNSISGTPLLDNNISNKTNVFLFDKKYRKNLEIALISLEEDSDVWMTYEEYSLIKTRVDDAVREDSLKVIVIRNNLYPDYYPLLFDVPNELFSEIVEATENPQNMNSNISDEATRYISIYNSIIDIDGQFFGSFYNFEFFNDSIQSLDFYQNLTEIEDTTENVVSTVVFINDDVETYLRDLARIQRSGSVAVGVTNVNSNVSKRILASLQAFANYNSISLFQYHETIKEQVELEEELKRVAVEEIRIPEFSEFRKIKFYKNPDISKEVVEISQAKIIQDIIEQAENAYEKQTGNGFRDIFITASTGAGKSVMFQIPAVYLAQKYGKLTIIIEPVKALMQDQKENLNNSGFKRVETFNSDLITQIEKEAVLKRIRNGEVDLLYLSPETLLSYSIETIIGERDIGLLIVDEAHIVTTWGMGFRPDYWYLGGYINRLRNQIQTRSGMKRKTYSFPVCAFTATAINGGIDDSVGDTVVSLYMENPIKYIGYVKRDDISFEITHRDEDKKLSKPVYEEAKCDALRKRLELWLENNEKTIVYFPYASQVYDAFNAKKGFAGLIRDPKRIGTYESKNIEGKSLEAFKEDKRSSFEGFRDGSKPIMFATNAFGMGVDVKDVKNVYHYAASGTLCDYVQEIGRAARLKGMTGAAISDYYFNDRDFANVLFGMSRIRQYQIKKVLEGIYSTYVSKKENRNFLISPESFAFVFNGKSEGQCINQLKTCLLMLEKDFYDKYSFKVLISRPQGIFTKSYICIDKEKEKLVMSSKYAEHIRFVKKGKDKERMLGGSLSSDFGDIYSIDLKAIWEKFHPNISFPQFKYYFFTPKAAESEKVFIMPEIRGCIYPRQKISVETRKDLVIGEVREKILADIEYIADILYTKYGKSYFRIDDFRKLIKDRFGDSQARIIANSIFDLVDPNGICVKRRLDSAGRQTCSLSNGNFKQYLRNPITKSAVVYNMTRVTDDTTFTDFLATKGEEINTVALKLMSIFDYVTYEVSGGEEPEIFIRLNDPNKIRSIVNGTTPYSNDYVSKAQKKHDRDVQILNKFFNVLQTDADRWNFIEEYFLGYDVLADVAMDTSIRIADLSKVIDKIKSYSTETLKTWSGIYSMFNDDDVSYMKDMESMQLPIPDYLQPVIKKSDDGKQMIMVWSKKNVVVCTSDTTDKSLEYFEKKGWHAYRIDEIDLEKLQGELL